MPPVRRMRRSKTCRIIPTLYPPLSLFERIAPPEDWEALAEIESMTNERLRDAWGDVSLVPAEERVSGPGATPIMAAFTHPGPSRFSDGSYGIYYAALDLRTAIAESVVSRGRFYADSHEPPTDFDVRVHYGTVNGALHDLRGGFPEAHDARSHEAGQVLGRALREAGSYGVVYDSPRRAGGTCIAVFRPSILRNHRPEGHTWPGPVYRYHWDGARVSRYFDYEAGQWVRVDGAA